MSLHPSHSNLLTSRVQMAVGRWSACIRSSGAGFITAPLSHSFITQFVCTLSTALPCQLIHQENTDTRAHIQTLVLADTQHLEFLDVGRRAYTQLSRSPGMSHTSTTCNTYGMRRSNMFFFSSRVIPYVFTLSLYTTNMLTPHETKCISAHH